MRRAPWIGLLGPLGLLCLPLVGCPPVPDDDDAGGNSPPTAAAVVIEPAAPEAGEAITVYLTAQSWDPDGDQVTYRIEWTRDGEPQDAWTGPTVDPGVTVAGETWRAVVTPTDGRHDGPASADRVTVGGASDDDSGDDDAGDDDAGDDDAGDDDTEWPAPPWAYTQSAEIEATGGELGGVADVLMTWTIYDDQIDAICDLQWAFDATFDVGPGQGSDYFLFIDEVLQWDAGAEAFNSCPQPFEALFGADPWTVFAWIYHPMAFISCDLIGSNASVAAMFLGDDPFGSNIDGTFGTWCDVVGPELQSSLGSGPMEGIWLMGGPQGLLDGVGNYGYFAPEDTTHVESWMLLSLLMADAANAAEPTSGLEGAYLTVPIWMWLY